MFINEILMGYTLRYCNGHTLITVTQNSRTFYPLFPSNASVRYTNFNPESGNFLTNLIYLKLHKNVRTYISKLTQSTSRKIFSNGYTDEILFLALTWSSVFLLVIKHHIKTRTR